MDEPFDPSLDLVDAYHWLMSDESTAAAEAVAGHTDTLHQLVRKLQRRPYHLTNDQISLAIKHPELRQKAAYKFLHPERMWYEETLLEQSTDEAIAGYKASRFPPSKLVTDFCCGLGGDLIALSHRGPVAAVDRSPVALLLAEANVRSLRTEASEEAKFYQQEAATHVDKVWSQLPAGSRYAHMDPDRRASGVRTSGWEYTEPGPDMLETLRSLADGLAVKLAPATNPPSPWVADCERDWIGSRGQCRQQMLWCGELARHTGQSTVTVVDHDGWERFVPRTADHSPPLAQQPGRYLLEPHAAILAAQLGEAFGAEHELLLAAPHGGYLTGSRDPGPTLLAARFEVESWLPFDAKRVRKHLRASNPARLEIKRRGIPDTPDQIAKKLKWKPDRKVVGNDASGQTLTLVIARLQTRVVAMFCRRLP